MNPLAKITDPSRSAYLYICGLLFTYALIPLTVNQLFFENRYFVELARICLVSCVGIAVGFNLPFFDYRFSRTARRFAMNDKKFHLTVWITFFIFVLVTFSTAKSIPIISAVLGAGKNQLSQQRGEFLKARVGIESVLLYVNAMFLSTLLPYSIAKLFVDKNRYRYLLVAGFLVYSVSYLNKALFLSFIFPLLYISARKMHLTLRKALIIGFACFALLNLLTVLSSGKQTNLEVARAPTEAIAFFTAGHIPSSSLEFLAWRSVAVPMFTASDTLAVFDKQFNGQPLHGATSTFISALLGLDRVNIERYVFEYQFGGWNDIANANAVFMTDAYVNFGWAGVVLFSLFVGQSLRWFWKSKDEAFKSLWILYCFSLFSATLIGMILSNGYFYMFFHALFVKLSDKSTNVQLNNSGG